MANKYRKKKEAIRDQILKKVTYYRKKRGIHFFDTIAPNFKNTPIPIDDNDIAVLLIRLNRVKQILITTKYLYLINKATTIKIKGEEIDRFDYMEFINGYETYQKASKFKRICMRFKINFRKGTYRIVKKDESYIEISFRKTKFPDCLNGCIKKLKFVANKYEGY